MRGAAQVAGAAVVAALLSACTAQPVPKQEASGDSIRLAGHGDNFRCDDPAYASVKKVHTFTLSFGDGQTIQLCGPDTPDRAPLRERGDLILELTGPVPAPEDPIALYQKAKQAKNMRDAHSAILMAQARYPLQADRMWRDYWETAVLPAFRDKPETALLVLKSAAKRGLPSAMARLAEAYRKGEFGLQVNEELAADWADKAAKAAAKD